MQRKARMVERKQEKPHGSLLNLYGVVIVLAMFTVLSNSSCRKAFEDPALTNSTWMLFQVTPEGEDFGTFSFDSVLLNFNEDNTYTLDLEVNRCAGNYSLVRVGRITMQEPSCGATEGDSEVSRMLLATLGRSSNYDIAVGTLTITGEGRVTFIEVD